MRKARSTVWAAVLAIAGALAGTASHAQQQVNLSNLPPNSVVGRLGGGLSGGAQSIPFATLLTQLNGLTTVVSGPATTTAGDMVLWNNAGGTLVKDSGIAVTGTGTIAMGSANTLTLSASPTFSGSGTYSGAGTLNVASGKTLTDTSGAGAVLLLGTTGGGFTGYAGTSACATGTAINVLSTTGVATCVGAKAATNATAASPAGPNATGSFKMQGLATTPTSGSAIITPTATGNILITISGTIITTSTAAGNGIQYQISYGTGTAPTTNAALTGTQVGTIQQWEIAATLTAANSFIPFSLSVVVTGLTVGTAYWIDLAAEAINSTNTSFQKVNIAVNEI